MTEPLYDLQPGRTLGPNYFIVEFIGSGWEGEVYKVEERHTGIIRAAKIFYPQRNSNNKTIRRYAKKLNKLRTCPIVMQYHHRSIGRVKKDQVEFLISEFIEGEMLSSFVNRYTRKSMPLFEALHLYYAIVSGVEQIHYLGEYHGDIHSDNIMVSRKGLGFNVSLIDFYDLGASSRLKIQQDVYDLTSLLYEIIGGVQAYKKASPEIKQLILGRKHSLIKKQYRNAGHLRLAMDNLNWR